MALKSYAQLIAGAQQILNETVKKANDKLRLGGLFTDIIDSKEEIFTRVAEVPSTLATGKFALVGTQLYVGDAEGVPTLISGSGGGGGGLSVDSLIENRMLTLLDYAAGNAGNAGSLVNFTPNEGMTVPDGASEIFVKTVPLGRTATRGVITRLTSSNDTIPNILFGASGLMTIAFSSSSVYTGIPVYVDSDYTKSFRPVAGNEGTVGNAATPVPSLGGMSYSQLIGYLSAFIGRYSSATGRNVWHNQDNNFNAIVLSMHIENNNLVVTYQKYASTTGVSMQTGNKFLFVPV